MDDIFSMADIFYEERRRVFLKDKAVPMKPVHPDWFRELGELFTGNDANTLLTKYFCQPRGGLWDGRMKTVAARCGVRSVRAEGSGSPGGGGVRGARRWPRYTLPLYRCPLRPSKRGRQVDTREGALPATPRDVDAQCRRIRVAPFTWCLVHASTPHAAHT